MSLISFTGLVDGGKADEAIASATLLSTLNGALVVDYSSDAIVDLDTTRAGLSQATTTEGIGDRVSFDLNGTTVSIAKVILDAASHSGSRGYCGTIPIFLDPIHADFYAGILVCSIVNGAMLAFVSAVNGAGVGVFEIASDSGAMVHRFTLADDNSSFGDGITGMSVVEANGAKYLYVGSGSEHGLTGYEIDSDGSLVQVDSFGQKFGLPIQNITAMDAVVVGGGSFVLVAAVGSSSLIVLKVQSDGTLGVSDHVIDDRATRFENVASLGVTEGQALVLVSRADMGLSLFSLAPTGQLIQLETFADELEFGLDRVSSITTTQVGDRIEIFVTAEGDIGVSQFTIDMADFPNVVGAVAGEVVGQPGADILIDGESEEYFVGGAGEDVFVLYQDGFRDVVSDYEWGIDRIDLSGWEALYDISQLTVTEQSDGSLRLSHGGEILDVFSSDGRNLIASDAMLLDISVLSRFDAIRAELPEPSPSVPLHLTLVGTEGEDTLVGGAGDDQFQSGSGDDWLVVGKGADVVYGDLGMDVVSYEGAEGSVIYDFTGAIVASGEAANDTLLSIEGLVGSDFNDLFYGDSNANFFVGSSGDDRLDGAAGDDWLYGGDGDDGLLGREGDDYLYGGVGNDRLPGADGDDVIYGGDGDDALGGGEGNDQMYGGQGNDRLGAGPGEDYMEGGDGNDGLASGPQSDWLDGGAGDDRMAGSYGSDTLFGGEGNDRMGGGYGHDLIYAGDGGDVVGAGPDNDTLYGGAGDDVLNSADGDDAVFGGRGDDRINAGAGDDIMGGGSGADIFVFSDYNSGEQDVVVDFEIWIDQLRMARVGGSDATVKFSNLDIQQDGTDAVITWRGQEIRLVDTLMSDLDVNAFLFV